MNSNLEDIANQIIWMNSLKDIVQSVLDLGLGVVIGIILLSVLQVFFGYIIFRYEMGLIGASVLGAGCFVALKYLLHYKGIKLVLWTAFAAFMGGGMMFTVSAIIVFLVAVLGTGAAVMYFNLTGELEIPYLAVAVIAVAAGLICALLYRHVIIIGNVITGSTVIGLVLYGLFESRNMALIVGGIFALLGLITQYAMYIGHVKKEKQKDQEYENRQIAEKTRVVDENIRGVKEYEDTSSPNSFAHGTVNGRPAPRIHEDREPDKETVKSGSDSPFMSANVLKRVDSSAGGSDRNGAHEGPVSAGLVPESETDGEDLPPLHMSDTGTISVGDIKSHMKRL